MTHPDPATLATQDQVDAAERDTAHALDLFARHANMPRHHGPRPPWAAAVAAQFDAAAAAELDRCPHIPGAPAPHHWTPEHPGHILCTACLTQWLQRLRGTPQNHTCSLCRHEVPDGTGFHTAVIDAGPFQAHDDNPPRTFLIGPVLLHAGLCPTCTTRDPRHVFTCPRCGKGSTHPDDARHGYCGRCHDWTAPPADPT